MKLILAASVLASIACLSQADSIGSIPLNAKIYVNAATGFNDYLATAVKEGKVPVNITAQKDGADFELQALSGASVISAPDWSSAWLHGYGEAGIRLVSLRSGEMMFIARFDRNASLQDWKSAAEICAGRIRLAVNRATSTQHPADPVLDFSH
jgi:hypothetical protein